MLKYLRDIMLSTTVKKQECLGQGCLATLPRGTLQGDLRLSDRRRD